MGRCLAAAKDANWAKVTWSHVSGEILSATGVHAGFDVQYQSITCKQCDMIKLRSKIIKQAGHRLHLIVELRLAQLMKAWLHNFGWCSIIPASARVLIKMIRTLLPPYPVVNCRHHPEMGWSYLVATHRDVTSALPVPRQEFQHCNDGYPLQLTHRIGTTVGSFSFVVCDMRSMAADWCDCNRSWTIQKSALNQRPKSISEVKRDHSPCKGL